MQFWIKLCNCVLVVGLLCGYQAIQNHRTQEEEIAKLEAQLQQQAIAAEDTETVDSPYQDGVYEGEAQGYGGTAASASASMGVLLFLIVYLHTAVHVKLA